MFSRDEIQALVQTGKIKGSIERDIQPASLNLRFTNRAIHFLPGVTDIQESKLPLDLIPGRIYTLASAQVFSFPSDVCAMVMMRRSCLCHGLSLASGGPGLISPGYFGSISLDIQTSVWTRIDVDTPIAEICFWRLDTPAVPAYTGTYQEQQLGRSITPQLG